MSVMSWIGWLQCFMTRQKEPLHTNSAQLSIDHWETAFHQYFIPVILENLKYSMRHNLLLLTHDRFFWRVVSLSFSLWFCGGAQGWPGFDSCTCTLTYFMRLWFGISWQC